MNENRSGSDFKKANEETFDNIWEGIVVPLVKGYECESGVIVRDLESAKSEARRRYVKLNALCSNEYMNNPKAALDRHKVGACFSYALAASRLLGVEGGLLDDDRADDDSTEMAAFANERMALAVGYSIVTSYVLEALKRPEMQLSDTEREIVRKSLASVLPFPDAVGHGGTYILNTAKALYISCREKNVSVLMLANILFLWESAAIPGEYHRAILSFFESRPAIVDVSHLK